VIKRVIVEHYPLNLIKRYFGNKLDLVCKETSILAKHRFDYLVKSCEFFHLFLCGVIRTFSL